MNSSPSRLPASIAGAFAAAAYALQSNLQNDELPEEQDPGLLPQLYASRIGPHSQVFYLKQFKRFDALDRSLPSWNMAAAFFTLAWCCLRGLWLEAAQYVAAVAALALVWWFGIGPALASTLPPAMTAGLGAAFLLVTMAVPGLLGNGWYWRKVRAQTLQAIAAAPNMAQAHAALKAQACPSQNKIAALLMLALPAAAIAGASLALLPQRTGSGPTKAPLVQAEPAAAASAIALSTTVTPARPDEPVTGNKPVAAPVPVPAPVPLPEPAPAITEPVKAQAASVQVPASDLIPGKFYLNVGVYSEPVNAEQVLAQLQKSKLPALSQKMTSNKGEVTRLRSGPFESRKRAERAARKLKAAKIDASIFQSSGKAAAP
ncbi:SPOR domain-containing protein [Comamonas sp. Y33R10-2]|uniref:SPOR domain-containing protein n=1 Tax=Comamonas sp. Y33R10-2 TaxID=2853257 RepID=UPI0021057AFC|nr:SPOR domain-containing protein [Comamonas sp. Y33R10-2]